MKNFTEPSDGGDAQTATRATSARYDRKKQSGISSTSSPDIGKSNIPQTHSSKNLCFIVAT
jgi:hypothetical protein